MIDYDESGRPAVRVGHPGPALLLLSEPTRPFEDEPTLDFLIKALGPWGSVETSVETWNGDGFDTFLSSLAEDFRGWEGARTWHSVCYDLTLSAEHRGSHVELTWGIHDRAPSEGWHFKITTAHAPGEDMRALAADIHTFIASFAE
ncbi:DUF6228 family protein [Streptomyces cellulosae]|uniref:DUF6228 family protein n=1 Tax=Streptomyces TaxID=1883 RepID=UPI0013716781|nr:DUF6228 family protein [Streptomyces cellulosae]MXQ59995.1 hypothetical protein [Streptomyces sp. XHT-2]WSB49001.1 DUF6228 family protein [Streptomyces cellulosae]WSB55170.1 DUF6228 family protein [Streptomyces cellulosae]WTB70229.1 DUF6228 family protein [Streptomyces cellulosae]